MTYFFDTGILLRLFHRLDPEHEKIKIAYTAASRFGNIAVTAIQNLAEFWNVSTRPTTARGGFGLPIQKVAIRVRFIERHFKILHESPDSFGVWKDLMLTYGVRGVQAHDARLVAVMKAAGVSKIITLNAADFHRYQNEVEAYLRERNKYKFRTSNFTFLRTRLRD